jgi:hypothetical protein
MPIQIQEPKLVLGIGLAVFRLRRNVLQDRFIVAFAIGLTGIAAFAATGQNQRYQTERQNAYS